MNTDVDKLFVAIKQHNEDTARGQVRETVRKAILLSMEASKNELPQEVVQSLKSQVEFLWKQLTLDEKNELSNELSNEENKYLGSILYVFAPDHASVELISTVKNTENRIQSVEEAVFSLAQKVNELEKTVQTVSTKSTTNVQKTPEILKD